MVADGDVLAFFRQKLPELSTLTFKRIPLQRDDVLQEYTDLEDLSYAVDDYGKTFDIDVSVINMDVYFPWEIAWFFRKWCTNEPIKQTAKPLAVRMFAESAKVGRWLYD